MSEHSYDAARAIERAIRRRFPAHGVNFVNFASWPWASVTFSGARHEFSFRLEGERADAAAQAFLSDLDCAEFDLRGHILADIALVCETSVGDAVEISLEALTVEDG